jgi:DNA (cytosine-5)-methyltransferase 1
MKILNLYSGIGGNRKNWKGYDVTAVESESYIADAYRKLYPDDEVIVGDAHQYLLENFSKFDFIWSSPPCPTHSRASTSLRGWGIYRYPDMRLYQEIIFLKHFYKGKWVVENVIPYYEPLIKPTKVIDRHSFWTNFNFIDLYQTKPRKDVSRATKEVLSEQHGIVLPVGTKDQRKLLRNAVDPDLGLHVLRQAIYSI